MTTPKLLVVDNYDSFTFMLGDYLAGAGATVDVRRSDSITAADALAGDWNGFVISPGPGRPEDAGVSIALAAACMSARRPLLGVCLGHQAIVVACGGTVSEAAPVHGKTCAIEHDASGLFAELPSPFPATRYHSLVAEGAPPPLVANARTKDGLIMGVRHAQAPVHGVQFHPESIATENGRALVAAFVSLAAA